MGGKRLYDGRGHDSKRPPVQKLPTNNLNSLSCMERYSPDFYIPKLLVLENTILRRIPRLDRWHNANHEQGKNKAFVFHLSQEVESATVVNFSLIQGWRP